MKISTWNVNGFRSAFSKGAGSWIKSSEADIVCLQEIRTRPEQVQSEHLTDISEYQLIWNPAETPNSGYSGVATLTKVKPLEISLGWGNPLFDLEGRVICTKFTDFTLYNIYFPNGQRGQDRIDYKLNFYAELLDICDRRHEQNENIIICGDFNTAHKEIDLKNPKENEKNSGFLPEERIWIDHYLEHGFVDIYRQFYPELTQYTWWTYRFAARKRNIGWRIDYFLISKNFVECVENVLIEDSVQGSDHCPVNLFLKV